MIDGATGTKTYFHQNHQGSVIALSKGTGTSNELGTIQQAFAYSPYGDAQQTVGGGSGLTGSPFGYAGRLYDHETNFYYSRARGNLRARESYFISERMGANWGTTPDDHYITNCNI